MYELNRKEFGKFLAQLRREKGLTQKEIAQGLMISDKAVSKWETGVSIPDTALLIPLGELLGVSVTELLMAQRMEKPMAPEKVEAVVQCAISYQESPRRAWQEGGAWGWWYALALVIGLAGWYGNHRLGTASQSLSTPLVLAAVIGGYGCFLAPVRLPRYYDENRISYFADGAVRMNLFGIRFSNKNWLPILKCLRLWAMIMLTVYPLIFLGLGLWLPASWHRAELWISLAILLGGLFLPLYLVGRKYEDKA